MTITTLTRSPPMTITTLTPARAQFLRGSAGRRLALASLLGLGLALPTTGVAQEAAPVREPVEDAAPDSLVAPSEVSPSGAFLRAVLLPGWGHASIGSYTRGGFYFAAEVTTGWGLLRTHVRLSEALDRIAFREDVIRAELAALGVEDADEIQAALEGDEVLEDLSDLVASREDQQEDWAALGIFLLFLAGADAFVSAHLADFPVPIDLNATPLPGGRLELSVGVRLPNR